MNEIIKYKKLYKVLFKEDDPKLITPEQFEIIKEKLFKNEWIEIDNELYNPFQIKKIIKHKSEDWIMQILNNESEEIKKIVKWYMKLYKNDLTIWVIKNMIKKANEIL